MKEILKIKIYFEQMRIKSWLKNIFVLIPITFSLELFNWDRLLNTIVLLVAFCFISSTVYILNDLVDVENDRKHSTKKYRPIASGQISVLSARILMICLFLIGTLLAFRVNLISFYLILAYLVVNILYTIYLKKVEIIDCFCIAAGFVLRVLVGGTTISDGVSDWLFLTVLAMSLFMAFGKRRGELNLKNFKDTRDVLKKYEFEFLSGILFMCAGLTIVFYSLWSLSQGMGMIYTVPFALYIVIKYLLLIFLPDAEADPITTLLSSKTLFVACVIYAALIVLLLYFFS
jgi:decaprenyl-phosphate phosphoribosyltransferase